MNPKVFLERRFKRSETLVELRLSDGRQVSASREIL
jgi:hypothetical protein